MSSNAFVILTCKLGSINEIKTELKRISGVVEVDILYGVYDIIVRVSVNSVEELNEIIKTQIKGRDRIISTLTLTQIDNEENSILKI